MAAPLKRLYIITGKGGVGKTTVSLAFTRWLRAQGHDALHMTFESPSMSDSQKPTSDETLFADVPRERLSLEESAEGYILKKLGSGMIARWIVRTAFFRALSNMMPGFGYVIFLGKTLEMLQGNERIIVLDAPASGHALAMLEATSNFREIFRSGLVYEDTEKMLKLLYDPQFTAVRILALPTQMAMQEAKELLDAVKNLGALDCHILLNHSLERWQAAFPDAPTEVQSKWQTEQEVRSKASEWLQGTIPFSAGASSEAVWKDISPSMEGMT
jgi:anion-transporting  ArsA/GET3 family ATPase